MPPSIGVEINNFVKNNGISLEIKIDDSFPGTGRVAPNIYRNYHGTGYSGGLQKVELYKGKELLDTLPLDCIGQNECKIAYTITEPDGEFFYRVVAYDRAGNKAIYYLSLTVIDGQAIDSIVLRNDKNPPEVSLDIDDEHNLTGSATDTQSGLRALHLYESTNLIVTDQGSSLSFDKAQIGKMYHLEAEDFAGNVAKSEPFRFTYHKFVPAECIVPRCLTK